MVSPCSIAGRLPNAEQEKDGNVHAAGVKFQSGKDLARRGGSRRVARAERYDTSLCTASRRKIERKGEREKGTGRAAGSAPVQKIRAHFRSARPRGVELTNLRGRLSDREFRELRRALARDAVGRGD